MYLMLFLFMEQWVVQLSTDQNTKLLMKADLTFSYNFLLDKSDV